MDRTIVPYNKFNINKVSIWLCEYKDTRDYRYLFSSSEWIQTFINIYNPLENFFIRYENSQNYASLSVVDGKLCFTGDPFNDFNGFLNVDGENIFDIHRVIKYFFERGYSISWQYLFEKPVLADMKKFAGGALREQSSTSLKIDVGEDVNSYDSLISKRTLKMYQKLFNRLLFFRMFGDEIAAKPDALEYLLSQRRKNLYARKIEELNPSFEPIFDSFVRELLRSRSLWKNVFLDCCSIKETGEIVAASLNFVKGEGIICYLRAHTQSTNDVSYGLVLDYWGNNVSVKGGIETIDLTRGEEPYKYRLGCKEYYLDSFVI